MNFDHCYQRIRTADEYFALANRGFHLDDKMVEHPGKQLCRFIKFKRKNSTAENQFQYLEFVEVADFEALKATYASGTPDDLIWEPGLSLLGPTKLKEFYLSASRDY